MSEANDKYFHHRLSVRRIVFFIIGASLIFGSAYLYIDYNKKKKDPCRYESYASLMARFSELKELWNRQQYQLKILEARHELQSAQGDIALERGTISADRALAIEQKMADELLQLSEHQTAEFGALCRKLVSQSKN